MALGLFWTLVGIQVLGLMASAYSIGKPRKPYEASAFAVQVFLSALIIVALFIWGNAFNG
jgi:formate hydrogenlyase subunit 3/multisubunit Na+/H+ antiporter MnhD subunit